MSVLGCDRLTSATIFLHHLVVQLGRKRSFYDPEIRSLRKQLRDTYESLLFLDAAFSAANDVEAQLWRTVFYMPIEEFRARLRKADKEAQQKTGQVPVVSVLCSMPLGSGGNVAVEALHFAHVRQAKVGPVALCSFH